MPIAASIARYKIRLSLAIKPIRLPDEMFDKLLGLVQTVKPTQILALIAAPPSQLLWTVRSKISDVAPLSGHAPGS